MNRKILYFLSTVILGLAGCAGTAETPKLVSVSPRQVFADAYVNVTAPHSEGWYLIQSSGSGIELAKKGLATNESFAAQVLMFNLAPTQTPQELEMLLKGAVEKDTEPVRFDTQQMSFKYSTERSYPCARYHSVVQDKAPPGLKGPMLLESHGLYCRHPVRQETGFAVIYSHRGASLYADLRSEAENFIQGVQVPGK